MLSRIPLLGVLFGSKANLDRRTELIVFLTPYIYTGDASMPRSKLQEVVPYDIVPEDLQKKIISEKANAITIKPQEKTFEEILLSPKDISQAKGIEKEVASDIQKRMKEIKEY